MQCKLMYTAMQYVPLEHDVVNICISWVFYIFDTEYLNNY